MANYSFLGQNANVKKDENVEIFPYRILNDLSKKLKAAQATIANMLAEREAIETVKNGEINNLKQRLFELTYENNRYHLAISNCTFCATDDAESSSVSSVFDESIRTSTPIPFSLPCTVPVPAPMLGSTVKENQAKTVVRSKDKTYIARLIKTLTKLELKYATPEHKRKKRLFTRKQKTSPIVPKEFDTIYHVLAAPEPDAVTAPDPFPHVRWFEVKFKPALTAPERCPTFARLFESREMVEKNRVVFLGSFG